MPILLMEDQQNLKYKFNIYFNKKKIFVNDLEESEMLQLKTAF